MTPHLDLVITIVRSVADSYLFKESDGDKATRRFLLEAANHIEVREEHYESAKAMVRRLQSENEELRDGMTRLHAAVEEVLASLECDDIDHQHHASEYAASLRNAITARR